MFNSTDNPNFLPYHQVPKCSDYYSAGTVVARLIDALGFRFYWATNSLRKEDLDFQPANDVISVNDTINHIYSMIAIVFKSVCKRELKPIQELSFEEKRTEVLWCLKSMSEVFKDCDNDDFERFSYTTSKGESIPFWFFINGQITDCIWHCGQISIFRRMSGNPLNSKISFFKGKERE